jgi:histone demethylase JARID1
MGGTHHAGFSHGNVLLIIFFLKGLNCSEAVNIAPTQWLNEYGKAVDLYRKHGNCRKVSFPLEWLLVKIIKNISTTKFSKNHLL